MKKEKIELDKIGALLTIKNLAAVRGGGLIDEIREDDEVTFEGCIGIKVVVGSQIQQMGC
jgi:hypothetical protein